MAKPKIAPGKKMGSEIKTAQRRRVAGAKTGTKTSKRPAPKPKASTVDFKNLTEVVPKIGLALAMVERAITPVIREFALCRDHWLCWSCSTEARHIEITNMQQTKIGGITSVCPPQQGVTDAAKAEIKKRVDKVCCERKCESPICRCLSTRFAFTLSDSEHHTVYTKMVAAVPPWKEVPQNDPSASCLTEFDVSFDIELVWKIGICLTKEVVVA